MLFEKLADKIMRHAKLIICIWVILLIASVPFVYKVLAEPEGILQYDMTKMVSTDSESVQGLLIIEDPEYFYQSDLGTEMLLVIECKENKFAETDIGSDEVETVYLPALYKRIVDHYGEGIAEMVDIGFQTKDEAANPSGIVIVSIGFTDDRTVSEETSTLRGLISDAKTDSGLNPTTYLTGNMAISQDTLDGSMQDVMKIDPFSILLVLVLIGLFFRSLISSATPPMTIGFAYGIVMMVIYGLAQFMQIYYVTSTIVLVSMLGAGCDYCIFIIARYREERKEGKDKEGALREAIIWAGESITTSGLSVIIGFGVISFCSFSMVSTMGMVLASGIIFALLAALTLIPSILMMVGDKIFYPSTMESFHEDSKVMSGWYGRMSDFGKRYFKNSAKLSIKYAGVIVIAVLILTVPLAYVTMTETTSYDMISIMPESESKEGVNAIVANSDGGMIMPTYVLLDVGKQIAEINDKAIPYTDPTTGQQGYLGTVTWVGGYATAATYSNSTTEMLVKTPGAHTLPGQIRASAPDNIASINGIISSQMVYEETHSFGILKSMLPTTLAEYIDLIDMMRIGGMIDLPTEYMILDYILNYNLGSLSNYVNGHQYIRVTVTVEDQPMSEKSMNTLRQIEEGAENYMALDEAKALFATSLVTGSVVAIEDISDIVNKEFLWIEIAVVVLILLLLFVVMRSYLTPVRSVVTIVMSVVWTLGMTHLLFGHLLGMPVTWIVPIILFVICLGLGMDYDILLTTRIKENVMKGMSNDDAILHAVEKSGAVITICGLIMGGAFLTMVLSTSPMLMEFGFALGFAILVDALFVRTYVVPAVMHLLGRWNWIGPSFLSIKRQE